MKTTNRKFDKDIDLEFKEIHTANVKVLENNRLALNVESCPLSEGIAQNEQLLKRLNDTSKAIESASLQVIDDMALVFDQKRECVEKIRDWRKTIEGECKIITSALNTVAKIDTEKLSDLKEMVDLLERMQNIKQNFLLEKFLK